MRYHSITRGFQAMIANTRSFLLNLRNRHFLAADLLIFAITPALATLVRLEGLENVDRYVPSIIIYTWVFAFCKLGLLWMIGLYHRFWPYASVDALTALVLSAAAVVAAELFVAFGLLFPLDLLPVALPRSVPIINAGLTILLVGSTRLAVRVLFELSDHKKGTTPTKPVLIAGAGAAGAMVVKELRMNPQVGLHPVAFLDDDPRKRGVRIHGIPVVGTLADLPTAVKEYRSLQVIIAMPTAPGKVVRDLVQACKQAGVTGRTVPGIFEILSGTARVSELRDIQVEDLLRRGVVRGNPQEISQLIQKKRVMVTGAGGSIGSELCRQIGLCDPSELILVGHGENSIFKIARELQKNLPASIVPAVIADIRDKKRMNMVFRAYRPEIIFHAAAHKHVGLMQSNVPEAVTNNVLGTRNLVELAAQYDVERFVMISSDKAVNPTSIMGVTKRIAELVVHDAATTTGRPFVSVRFGNVLGSRGSVVPIFKAQIASGGPVTVSDPGRDPFLHDNTGSGATGAPGRSHGNRRRSLCAGYGRAGSHTGPGKRCDSLERPDRGDSTSTSSSPGLRQERSFTRSSSWHPNIPCGASMRRFSSVLTAIRRLSTPFSPMWESMLRSVRRVEKEMLCFVNACRS